jgi:hypothetical protein
MLMYVSFQLFVVAILAVGHEIAGVFNRICPFVVYHRLWVSIGIFDLRNACMSGSLCSLWSQVKCLPWVMQHGNKK